MYFGWKTFRKIGCWEKSLLGEILCGRLFFPSNLDDASEHVQEVTFDGEPCNVTESKQRILESP